MIGRGILTKIGVLNFNQRGRVCMNTAVILPVEASSITEQTAKASYTTEQVPKSSATYLAWDLPDALWALMEPLIPPKTSHLGRPRTVDLRKITAGIFYVLRTGTQWQAAPRERFGPPSTVYAYFSDWVEAKVFEKLWAKALEFYDDLQGLEWKWLSIDGAMTKAPLGGAPPDLTRPTVGSEGRSGVS